MALRRLSVLLLAACAGGGDATDDADTDDGPVPADLVEPSGACPDLSEPGLKTITSAGQEREFGIWFPEDPPAGLPLIFAFHGLVTPDFDAIGETARGYGIERLASDQPAIIVVPEALVTNLVVADVLLWGILGEEQRAADLQLFDDLRTCVARAFDADMKRVTAFGHSGGGLWTSVLLGERSTALATGVASSGGTGDFPAPTYKAPERNLPALLIDGGPTDAWPDPAVPIIPFQTTTMAFRDALAADGNPVAWCEHDLGHFQLPSWWFRTVTTWLKKHRYGEPSPYFGEGNAELPAACERFGP